MHHTIGYGAGGRRRFHLAHGLWLLAILLATRQATAQAVDELRVLPEKIDGRAPTAIVAERLRALAMEALDERTRAYEAIKTPEQCAAWQEQRRATFRAALGDFPERTPLMAQVVGQEAGEGFRVEKILFESQPRHFVSGLLYLPLSKPPFPAVLVACGHSANGKASQGYQRLGQIFARHGLAAFCYDPVGQGERYQILDDAGKSRFGPTTEHTLLGAASILVGRNTATYRIWDGMRAMDYLASRTDIDARRFGCTGDSGGGTETSYLMALDERVFAAAPACYLTSWRRLLETLGPQDAEQNLFGQIRHGLDHADYMLLRAPRPTLICATTKDFFDIQGTWASFREAKRFYARLGAANRVELAEVDAGHGFNKLLREAACEWMGRWLLDRHAPVEETEPVMLSTAQTQCTAAGQTLRLPGARSVTDLTIDLERELAPRRAQFWKETPPDEALAEVRRRAGIRTAGEMKPLSVEKTGSLPRQGHRLDKLDLRTEDGVPLPALAWLPERPAESAVLVLHGEGKQAALAECETLVRQGLLALAVDLRGCGETGRNGSGKWYSSFGGNSGDFFLAYLLGQSYLGLQAEDALRAATVAAQYELPKSATPRKVRLLAVGDAGPAGLHAAAISPNTFSAVEIRAALASYREALKAPDSAGWLSNAVHGALRLYDLPDLAEALRRRGVETKILDPRDGRGQPLAEK